MGTGVAISMPSRVMTQRHAIASMPRQALTEEEMAKVGHGNPVPATAPGERAALMTPDGRLLAIANRVGAHWQPSTVFSHA